MCTTAACWAKRCRSRNLFHIKVLWMFWKKGLLKNFENQCAFTWKITLRAYSINIYSLRSNLLFNQPVMAKWIFKFSLSVTIFIIFRRRYFFCAGSDCAFHYGFHVRNKQTDNAGSSAVF